MIHLIEAVLLSAARRINQAVFLISREHLLLYRPHGMHGVILTVSGPEQPAGSAEAVGYLVDGNDYIIVADDREPIAQPDWLRRLRTATSATIEITPTWRFTVDITVLDDNAVRTRLCNRLLKRASLQERHEIRKGRQAPIARLTPHPNQPTSGGGPRLSSLPPP